MMSLNLSLMNSWFTLHQKLMLGSQMLGHVCGPWESCPKEYSLFLIWGVTACPGHGPFLGSDWPSRTSMKPSVKLQSSALSHVHTWKFFLDLFCWAKWNQSAYPALSLMSLAIQFQVILVLIDQFVHLILLPACQSKNSLLHSSRFLFPMHSKCTLDNQTEVRTAS